MVEKMAVRKTSVRKTKSTARKPSGKAGWQGQRVSVPMVFWVLFFIILITAFFTLLPRVRKGVDMSKPDPQELVQEEPLVQQPPVSVQKPEVSIQTRPEPPPVAKAPEKQPTATEKKQPQEKAPEKKPTKPPATQQPTSQPPAASQVTEKPPVETRDRSIYLMQERDNADLLLVKVNRKLAVSNSPLLDSLNALLAGPTAEEKRRGLNSFIPPNSQLLSARIIGNTAHLNFNQAFRYNSVGREGGAAQLEQIVWTATEFPNIHNVQIEIDGKIVDFLMEGITIRNPIGRH